MNSHLTLWPPHKLRLLLQAKMPKIGVGLFLMGVIVTCVDYEWAEWHFTNGLQIQAKDSLLLLNYTLTVANENSPKRVKNMKINFVLRFK